MKKRVCGETYRSLTHLEPDGTHITYIVTPSLKTGCVPIPTSQGAGKYGLAVCLGRRTLNTGGNLDAGGKLGTPAVLST